MVNSCCTEEPQNFYKMVTEISTIESGYGSFRFVGTCNGLVCYVMSDFIYIYNPITGERIRVPTMGSEYAPRPVGFGYCRSTKTYKVVKIGQSSVLKLGQSDANFKASVQVYTLGEGSGWRYKPQVTYMLSGSGVFANGALHWLIKKRPSSSKCVVVAFDLADENFLVSPITTLSTQI
ncbi:hypothetical protein MKW92_041386 [Papaver armeniacum]|nr:hypothetical protein MKW92_041386 [Papaver armeniacum]